MPTWKAILLKAVGFGVSFALTVALVVGIWMWHVSRPKPWNNGAFKATFTGLQYQARKDAFVLEFRYSLENLRNVDYAMPSDKVLYRKMADGGGYASDLDAEIIGDVFIPARQRMNVLIRVPYRYEDFNTTFDEQSDEKKSGNFADRRLNRLDGFGLFDKQNKFQIEFRNDWSQWESVKNAFK